MFIALSSTCIQTFKVLRKASVSLMMEKFSRLTKFAASNIFSYFVSFGYTGERLIPGLRRNYWILRVLLLAGTSLWPHKVGFRGQIYSARWKLYIDHAVFLCPSIQGGIFSVLFEFILFLGSLTVQKFCLFHYFHQSLLRIADILCQVIFFSLHTPFCLGRYIRST